MTVKPNCSTESCIPFSIDGTTFDMYVHMLGHGQDDAPGVYMVMGGVDPDSLGYDVLDVVACDAVRSHIDEHQEPCVWGELGYEKIRFGAIYMDGVERDELAQKIRQRYQQTIEWAHSGALTWPPKPPTVPYPDTAPYIHTPAFS